MVSHLCFFASVRNTQPEASVAVRTAHALHCIALRYAASPDRPAEPVNPCANCCFQVVVSTAPNTHVRTSASWNLEAKLHAFDLLSFWPARRGACVQVDDRPGAVRDSGLEPFPLGFASPSRRVLSSPLLSSLQHAACGRALLFSGMKKRAAHVAHSPASGGGDTGLAHISVGHVRQLDNTVVVCIFKVIIIIACCDSMDALSLGLAFSVSLTIDTARA